MNISTKNVKKDDERWYLIFSCLESRHKNVLLLIILIGNRSMRSYNFIFFASSETLWTRIQEPPPKYPITQPARNSKGTEKEGYQGSRHKNLQLLLTLGRSSVMGRNFWVKLSARRIACNGTRESSSGSSPEALDPFLCDISAGTPAADD